MATKLDLIAAIESYPLENAVQGQYFVPKGHVRPLTLEEMQQGGDFGLITKTDCYCLWGHLCKVAGVDLSSLAARCQSSAITSFEVAHEVSNIVDQYGLTMVQARDLQWHFDHADSFAEGKERALTRAKIWLRGQKP